MAHALFGDKNKQLSAAWATGMLKTLKKPCGASRVLHSAASLYHGRKLSKTRQVDYLWASRYIQTRLQHLRYFEFSQEHLPLGSGVTEAACKTIFTQRLKPSGLAWSQSGAKNILTLRAILLSQTWTSTCADYLKQHQTQKF